MKLLVRRGVLIEDMAELNGDPVAPTTGFPSRSAWRYVRQIVSYL